MIDAVRWVRVKVHLMGTSGLARVGRLCSTKAWRIGALLFVLGVIVVGFQSLAIADDKPAPPVSIDLKGVDISVKQGAKPADGKDGSESLQACTQPFDINPWLVDSDPKFERTVIVAYGKTTGSLAGPAGAHALPCDGALATADANHPVVCSPLQSTAHAGQIAAHTALQVLVVAPGSVPSWLVNPEKPDTWFPTVAATGDPSADQSPLGNASTAFIVKSLEQDGCSVSLWTVGPRQAGYTVTVQMANSKGEAFGGSKRVVDISIAKTTLRTCQSGYRLDKDTNFTADPNLRNTVIVAYGRATAPRHGFEAPTDYKEGLSPGCSGDLDTASPDHPIVCMGHWNARRPGQIEPNNSLRVVVIRPDQSDWMPHVDAGGDPRLKPEQILGANGVALSPLATQELSPPTNPGPGGGNASSCVSDGWLIAPRTDGFRVTVSLVDAKGTSYAGSARSLEILVDQTYIGAVRIGIGVTSSYDTEAHHFGTSVYGVRQVTGGSSVINRDSWSLVDVDLIAGYTVFFGPAHRSVVYLGGWGVFFGSGLLSVSTATGNVTPVTSAYAGIEYSVGGVQFMALAGVHRENTLTSPYSDRQAVPPGTSVNATTYEPSFGLMVGYTADVFRIPGGSSN